MYPWPAFLFLGVCLAARTFAQCLSFDSASSMDTATAIENLPSAFGPHFVAPLVLAVGILLYAAADRADSIVWRRRVLVWFAAASLFLSFNKPVVNPMSRDLLTTLSLELAAPPQLMLAVLAILFTAAALRGDRTARAGLLVLGLAQSMIGRATVDIESLVKPRPEILGIVALGLMVHGLSQRRSASFVAGGAAAIIACLSAGELSNAFASETAVGVHALIAVLLVGGLAFDDRHAPIWKRIGAGLLVAAELAISGMHYRSSEVSLLYVAIVGAMAVAVARARSELMFALLAAFSVLLLEANAVWLGVTIVEARLAWRGAPVLIASWGLLLGGLHVSAWKGGAITRTRRWLLGLPSHL